MNLNQCHCRLSNQACSHAIEGNRNILQGFLKIATHEDWGNKRRAMHRQVSEGMQLHVSKDFKYSVRKARNIHWTERAVGTKDVIMNCSKLVLTQRNHHVLMKNLYQIMTRRGGFHLYYPIDQNGSK